MTLPLTPDLAFLLSAAMFLGAAGMLVCSRFAFVGKGTAPVSKTSLRVAMAQQRALPKLRRMLPAQIAERVVASIRATGGYEYAIILADLEDQVVSWCRANGVECPPWATMLEALVATPGVRKQRTKLNKSSKEHAYIRARQSCHGISNEYPMLYWIDDVEVLPVTGKVTRKGAASYPCPTPVTTVPMSVRSGIGHVSHRVSEPERRVA